MFVKGLAGFKFFHVILRLHPPRGDLRTSSAKLVPSNSSFVVGISYGVWKVADSVAKYDSRATFNYLVSGCSYFVSRIKYVVFRVT